MAPSSTNNAQFKGALRTKRKPDLLQIAEALGLAEDQDSRRDDLENAIREHLIANRSKLEANDRYEGLYNSIDKSDRRSARPSVAADSESDNGSPLSPPAAVRKHTQKARASVNGIANSIAGEAEKATADVSSLGTQLKTKARKSLDDLASAFRANATEAREEVSDVASEASHMGHALRTRVRNSTRRVEKSLKRRFNTARSHASDSGNLIRALLAIEFVFLVLTVLPTHYVQFGESRAEALLKHGSLYSSIPHWAVTLPDLRGLLSWAFWQPILLWTFWTLALPDVAAHLITFQRKHEASPVTFTYVRLALLVFLTRSGLNASGGVPRVLGVAAGQPAGATLASGAGSVGLVQQVSSHLSYESWVPLDATAQILATALAAGLATYEAIATRARAGA